MDATELTTKNIAFNIEDMNDLDKWLRNIISDVFLHLKHDMSECAPGMYQIGWTIKRLEQGDQNAIG